LPILPSTFLLVVFITLSKKELCIGTASNDLQIEAKDNKEIKH